MLIPAIDFKGGRVVQLVQGEREALATDDLDGWLAKFARFPLVQVETHEETRMMRLLERVTNLDVSANHPARPA